MEVSIYGELIEFVYDIEDNYKLSFGIVRRSEHDISFVNCSINVKNNGDLKFIKEWKASKNDWGEFYYSLNTAERYIVDKFLNAYNDRSKFRLPLYEKNEVKEYWIVHPIDEIVMIYKLDETRKYNRPAIYSRDNNISMGIFEELTIDLKRVFEE